MMGSYPMSEPQNSIFYLPILFCLLIYKLFHFGATGLYYSLLIIHSLHFIVGSFFIYLICSKLLNLNQKLSFVGAVIYLGLGWNANSLGVGTLSYMVGLIPVLFYVFLRYLKAPSVKVYILFVFVLSLFLYAGGVVNFFFYLWLNFLLIFVAIKLFRFKTFFICQDKKDCLRKGLLLFVVAPLWALAIYSVQLFSSYFVSHDISHASSSYDYLGFFGSRFYDLIGLIFPKFGLLYFGMQSNPQFLTQFSGANVFYIGIIPLALLVLGMVMVKNKKITLLFMGLAFFNLILAFGGLFFFYDITYFFPGNNLFRGHYKYLALFSIYISFIVPLVLSSIEKKKIKYIKAFVGIKRFFLASIGVLAFFAIVASFVTFGLGVIQRGGNYDILSKYYHYAFILASCFSGAVLILGLSLLIWHIFKNKSKNKYIEAFVGIKRFFIWGIGILMILAIIASLGALSFGILQRAGNFVKLNEYYNLALTFSSYFFRAVLIFCFSLIALYVFVKNKSWVKYLVIIIVILLDLSINYKYAMYYSTPIKDVVSKEFFQDMQGKTIVNSLDEYSQIYLIPEIIGTDPVYIYSAIPNKYLVKYDSLLIDKIGNPNTNLFLAGGINGLLRTRVLEDPAYKLVSSVEINKDNYKQFFAYNANGDIHNDWGDNLLLTGSKLYYYELTQAKKFYFSQNYVSVNTEKDFTDYLESGKLKPDNPVILTNEINDTSDKEAASELSSDVKVNVLENSPVYKKFQLDNQKDGLLVSGIPYSGIWKARVNGTEQKIYRANYSFLGIKTPSGSLVEIYLDKSRLNFFFFVSLFGFILLIGLWIQKSIKWKS